MAFFSKLNNKQAQPGDDHLMRQGRRMNSIRDAISNTIHQATTMLVTTENVLFPGDNHLLTTGTDDPTLWLSPLLVLRAIIKVSGHPYQWLAGSYYPEIGHFL